MVCVVDGHVHCFRGFVWTDNAQALQARRASCDVNYKHFKHAKVNSKRCVAQILCTQGDVLWLNESRAGPARAVHTPMHSMIMRSRRPANAPAPTLVFQK